MNAPVRICVVGSANVDLTFRTSRLPRPGETLTAKTLQLDFGGKGANQAVMAARHGAEVRFIARVGNDAFGQQTLAHLRAEGIDTAFIQMDAERPTGTAAIVVDDDAQNCILVVPGANAALSPADIAASALALQSADVVVAQLEVPVESILAAFRLARSAGVRTILNPAPAQGLPDELLQLTDLCVPNETEIEALTGQPAQSLDEAARAANVLRQRGAQMVLVTLGQRGALVVNDEGITTISAVPVEAVDPTGAGDAFIGSLAVSWAEGAHLHDAARRASAVAAVTVTRRGAQAAFPSREELALLLRSGRASI